MYIHRPHIHSSTLITTTLSINTTDSSYKYINSSGLRKLSLADSVESARTRQDIYSFSWEKQMEMVESSVPPGFRFHPTEEELVGYYLNRKVNSLKIDLGVIVDLDLYRMEPWDIQDRCGLGYEEQNEWYFFNHKDKKYPTGTRTNRATSAGFWKATGRDKAVVSKNKLIIGMRKTLVFYRGRAPNGRKTDWIMHEYRLQTTEHAPPQEEGWVVCRAFKKPSPNQKQGFDTWNHPHCISWDNGKFEEPSSRLDLAAGPTNMVYLNQGIVFPRSPFSSQLQDLIMSTNCNTHLQNQLVQLPLQLDYSDDPPLSTSLATNNGGADQLYVQNNNYSFNLPLVSQEFGLSAQNHASTLFTSLPDL